MLQFDRPQFEMFPNSPLSSCRGFFRLVLIRRDKLVINHMNRLKARPRQLDVDPECLRWTPVIVTNTVVSEGDDDDDDSEDEEEEPEHDHRKEVQIFTFAFACRSSPIIILIAIISVCPALTCRSNRVTSFHQCLGTCGKQRRGRKWRTRTTRKRTGRAF